MDRFRTIITALLIAGVAAAAAACGAVEDQVQQRAAGDAASQIPLGVDVRMLGYLDEKNVPGATVAVTKNGRLVLSKGYGLADLDSGLQMQPWHRTKIGSVSKLVTTIAALQLVEQDQLDLDDHLYASGVSTLWGADPTSPPGLVFSSDGVLANPGDYLQAVAAGVANLSTPDLEGILDPTAPPYLLQGSYRNNVEAALDWATRIQVRHVLSHTSGLLRSGSAAKAAEEFGKDEQDVTYPEVHQAVLMGVKGPPFGFPAGTSRKYSNHGFGLTGQIIAEVSGETYNDYTQANVFTPLGLPDVIASGTPVGPLDATGYVSAEDGTPVVKPPTVLDNPPINTSTGGWIATAQDLARVMCGIDEVSNNLRLLDHDTVDTMSTVWYPEASTKQPLGWDSRSGGRLTKNGSIAGGSSRVSKYLPGEVSDVEINVAVATNMQGPPPESLLREIAQLVADAEIPDDFDLFDDHPCYVPPGESLVNPAPSAGPDRSPSPSPRLGSTDPVPTATPAPTATPNPTRTTQPPPAVGDPRVRAEDIWTRFRDVTCGPTETPVRASVSSESDLTSVELHWSVGEDGDTGSVEMVKTASGFWSATLGPFDLDALPDNTASSPVNLTVVATDHLGERASAGTEVTLHPCPPVAR